MKGKSLTRKVGRRRELKTLVIFCEGEASEPDYINGLKRLPHIRGNTSITIEIDPQAGVPLTLVERAVARKRADEEVDEVWCVFDVEAPQNHPNLHKAMQLAKAHNIQLAVSNPCFELWLILHFEDRTAFMTTRAAESRSRHIDGRQGKRIDPDAYMASRAAAAGRATALAKRHILDDTPFPNDNPSSAMHALLASIDPSMG